MDVQEFDDDIFDRNIDQLDVRETPRCELSEEELDSDDKETLAQANSAPLMNGSSHPNQEVLQHMQNQICSPNLNNSNQGAMPLNTSHIAGLGSPPLHHGPMNGPLNGPMAMKGHILPPNCPALGPHLAGNRPKAENAELTKGHGQNRMMVHGQGHGHPVPRGQMFPTPPQGHGQRNPYVRSVGTASPQLMRNKQFQQGFGNHPKSTGSLSPQTLRNQRIMQFPTEHKKVSDHKAAALGQIMKMDPLQWQNCWNGDDADSVKDFTKTDREKETKFTKSTDAGSKKSEAESHKPASKQPWAAEEEDSVKDFSGNDRKTEETYHQRSEEAIYKRAAEEHIRRPPPWHDDEVDSVKNFGTCRGMNSEHANQRLSRLPSDENLCLSPPWNDGDSIKDFNAKAENNSSPEEKGGEGISRIPSDEHICLSPPWNEEEEEELLQDYAQAEKKPPNYAINQMVNEERLRQPCPPWHEEDNDSTKDFGAVAVNKGTFENSRRPSEENIYLTPPWMDDERESCRDCVASIDDSSVTNCQLTLEEKRAIEDEARNGAIAEPPQNVVDARETRDKEGVAEQPLIGRDSGFCSEQDQNQNQLNNQTKGAEVMAMTVSTQTDTATPIIEAPVCNPTAPTPPVQTQEFHPAAPIPQFWPRPASTVPHIETPPVNTAKPYQERPPIIRSVSQTSLEANCYSPHAIEGLETASVISFASTAATHHDLDTKIDMVQSLLSMLGTHDKDDMSRTLLAMSNSRDSCAAMRQSGCLPLLVELIHGQDIDMETRYEVRARAGLALHNIVYSNAEDRRGRREIRILRLLEIVRAHCDAVRYGGMNVHPCAARWYPPLRDHGPGPAVAALMKLSFEDDHQVAMCELGGLYAIGELLEVDHQVNGHCNDPYSINLRKYAGMALTNLTFGNTKNKAALCSMKGTLKALVAQVGTVGEEELVQVSGSVLRNLSWRADDPCKKSLQEAGAVSALLKSCQKIRGEPALRSLLSALWNLSAHCPENKTTICETPGALKFLVKALSYRSPNRNLSVVESSGGILRNISSHIAMRSDYRKIIRENNCFQLLLAHLRSPSQRVVSNSCGALWNLSARSIDDQELLWELGAVSLLKSLVNSKNKSIANGSASALRNLMAMKPSNSTDCESTTSSQFRRVHSMPASSRSPSTQAKLKIDRQAMMNRSRGSKMSVSGAGHEPPSHSKMGIASQSAKKTDSNASLCRSHSSVQSRNVERRPEAQSRHHPRGDTAYPRRHKAVVVGDDTSSIGSLGSNDSVSRQPCENEEKWSDKAGYAQRNTTMVVRENPLLQADMAQRENPSHCPDATPRSPDLRGGVPSKSSLQCKTIQLITDSYPLQVSVRPASRAAEFDRGGLLQLLGGRRSGKVNSEGFVSPGNVRKLSNNKGPKGPEGKCQETIEMQDMTKEDKKCPKNDRHKADTGAEKAVYTDAPLSDARDSLPAPSISQRSFMRPRRDESDPDADIDSDDSIDFNRSERRSRRPYPGRARRVKSEGEERNKKVVNAWTQSCDQLRPEECKPASREKKPSMDRGMQNIWVRRHEAGHCCNKMNKDSIELWQFSDNNSSISRSSYSKAQGRGHLMQTVAEIQPRKTSTQKDPRGCLVTSL